MNAAARRLPVGADARGLVNTLACGLATWALIALAVWRLA